jgi:peptidyl-prolyl cis-trans isomerase SDCCAG10
MAILNAFKAKLDSADRDRDDDMDMVDGGKARTNAKMNGGSDVPAAEAARNDGRDDEAALCDLHFIADCQSCSNWDRNRESIEGGGDEDEDKDDTDWMRHALSFAKDRLGKDLTWKRKNEEELVVIDPREREKEIKGKERQRKKAGASGGGGTVIAMLEQSKHSIK